MAKPAPAAVAFQFFTEASIISQLANTVMERHLPDGMSQAQFQVLTHLVRLGGAWGPARLAAAFQVTKAAMTFTLGRLEAQAFVQIDPDPDDGRAKLVRLTAAGRAAHTEAIARIAPMLAQVNKEFAAAELAAALPLLQRVRAYLDAARG
jgi:DNA-binding MarR family transcriptional regulator